MRRLVLPLLVLILVFGAMPVGAQHAGHGEIGSEDNTIAIVDGEKDVFLYPAPKLQQTTVNLSERSDNFQHLDVLKIVFGQETEKDFRITVQFKSLASSIPTGAGQRSVFFAYGKVNWRITPGTCQRQQATGAAPTTGCLSGQGGGQRGFGTVPWEVKASENAWVFTVPKDRIFNENRVPARFGDVLHNISASARQDFGFPGGGGGGGGGNGEITGGVYAYDRAPNVGADKGEEFVFVQGSNGRGHLALQALEPIRVSNGEATTIVYKVDVTNHDVNPLSVGLEALVDKKYLEQGWTVRVPPLMKLEAQQVLTFPVVLALPFTHNHGETALFKVAARSVEDTKSYAEVDLGVFWTDVPQPSAHHEGKEVGTWFHSKPAEGDFPPQAARDAAFPLMELWMNGVPDDPDPDATDKNVPAFFNDGFACTRNWLQGCAVPPNWQASWQIPLEPTLLLGLDFDLSKQGRMVFDILPKVTSASASVRVQLEYCDPTQQQGGGRGGGFGNATCYSYRTILAKGQATGSLTANTAAHFEIPLQVEPIADLVPYRKGHNIRLQIFLATDTPQNLMGTEPRPEFVTDKALLQLPLIEYHDPIDQAFENVGALALESLSPFEKPVNPGRTTVFQFNVISSAKEPQPVRLELQGVNSDWARIVGPAEFELAPGAKQNVSVAVQVPDDAVAEERAELFFVAQNLDDASVVAVTRLRATVVSGTDIPDEASLLGSAKSSDTPAIGPLFSLLAVLGTVAVLRRRRDEF